jgi:hypothetical protein
MPRLPGRWPPARTFGLAAELPAAAEDDCPLQRWSVRGWANLVSEGALRSNVTPARRAPAMPSCQSRHSPALPAAASAVTRRLRTHCGRLVDPAAKRELLVRSETCSIACDLAAHFPFCGTSFADRRRRDGHRARPVALNAAVANKAWRSRSRARWRTPRCPAPPCRLLSSTGARANAEAAMVRIGRLAAATAIRVVLGSAADLSQPHHATTLLLQASAACQTTSIRSCKHHSLALRLAA